MKNFGKFLLAVTVFLGISFFNPASGEAAATDSTPMYRMYNPNSGEHFYTENRLERNDLQSVGWNYEGIGWYAPVTGNPVYRLYNPNNGDHHYTLSASERDNLVKIGWRDEGVGWYSDPNQSVPLYRAFNPNVNTGSHNYAVTWTEQQDLINRGWHNEGIGWYGVEAESFQTTYVNHRGDTYNAPENSLPAFRQANAPAVETDLKLTKDRQWVLMHDDTLDRMTNGTGAVSDYTLAELSNFKIDQGTNVGSYAAAELKIPTLEDYLAICMVANKVPFLELKDATATTEDLQKVFEALAKYGFSSDNAKIISFNYEQLQLASQINPDFAYLYLVYEINQETIDASLQLGNQPGIDSYYPQVTSTAVRKARNAGLTVGTWTVPESQFSDMQDMRVDYVTTDQAPR
ncbi:glycerophosphodiester phosphodiesterase family protein [Enterococcus sp. HY326]|uniref:glycerophosphodiester phosphodiesterase family protein n=1 Tax=Enterococcus sp. HY326 TaxID=2971265 RepID=UPI00223FFA2F|nr:glycerophosphodiester phosphodiesterase family protein [Enterococcus sp. HY326]